MVTAWTADGGLDASGPARSSSVTHSWEITGGTGAYRAARGSLSVRDRESLLSATVITMPGIVLHAGRVSLASANRGFIARADALCETAAATPGSAAAVSIRWLRPAASAIVAAA